MNSSKILSVKINNLSRKSILKKIEGFLNGRTFHQIVTTNAEFILKAQEDIKFRNIINYADLSVADSVSIRYAFIRNFKFLKYRFSGINLMQEILKIAENKEISIFLVAKKDGLSDWRETKKVIAKKHPNLKIDGVNLNLSSLNNLNFKFKLLNYKKYIVFCNFGAPEQEKFINSLKTYQNICLGMGVGGSFDFLTGKIKRAPKWMQFLGLEWFYRLVRQPNRYKRIFNAVIIFPIRVILKK